MPPLDSQLTQSDLHGQCTPQLSNGHRRAGCADGMPIPASSGQWFRSDPDKDSDFIRTSCGCCVSGAVGDLLAG